MAAMAVARFFVFLPVIKNGFIARFSPHFAVCGDVPQPKYPRRSNQFKSAFVCRQHNVA